MLEIGDLAGAVRLCGTITDTESFDRTQVDLAIAHAEARRWDEAMNAIESIRGGAPRLVALRRVGVARGKAKDPEAAKRLFSRALEIAKDLKLDGRPDPTGPYHVALAQAESGDYRAARETMRRHRLNPMAEEDVELIALTQARAGELSRACSRSNRFRRINRQMKRDPVFSGRLCVWRSSLERVRRRSIWWRGLSHLSARRGS